MTGVFCIFDIPFTERLWYTDGMKYTMKPKVRELASNLVSIISTWNSIEAICLNEAAAEDTLDPYFALILDVYAHGDVPSVSKRQAAYPDHSVFETSPTGSKDRFMVGSLPVRIEYKSVDRIGELTEIALRSGSDLWKIRNSGTYVFYRLEHCKPLYEKSAWFDVTNTTLETITDSFWMQMRSFYQSTMDHFLSDFGAALLRDDPFHYLVSSASFIKYACAALYMENGQFEPSHRWYFSTITELKTLPSDFAGRFESFLRPDIELPPARKYEIAKLLATSIIKL